MNWYEREKLKGTLDKEKMEERLSFLLKKKNKIMEFYKPQRWQYYRKPRPDMSKIDEEIEKIQQQLYSFV